ncbi:DNA polymerase III subunit alpha [Streptomyces flavofungini]|uniref:DNA polymerase III subunit alpha n=1 Tax=Streptomyces flavofungini TaxID=68200 RepID=UPI0025B1692F|nr:DNA polymerase III subunit alpha [Streptomyces flavofungini]WJV51711.1 DNA polymerase III subunit alpha [Streptomyces flavofungini]
MPGFSHLHVASGYSARYGASHPDALVRAGAEHGMTTLALTDRDTVTGTVRFAKACAAHGIRPVFGVDLAVTAHAPAPPGRRPRTPVRGGAHVPEASIRIVLLARSAAGWAGVCRLVSAAHAHPIDGQPVASWEALAEHAGEDLTVLLGPASEPLRALSAGRPDIAEQLLAPWQHLLGDRVRLETVSYGLPGLGAGSTRLAAHTLALGDRLGIAVVLTNAVRYAHPHQHRLADVLDAARLLRPVPHRGPLDPGERHLKDAAAMAQVAERIAAAAGARPGRADQLLGETEATAEACAVDPVADLGIGGTHFPEPHVVGAGSEPGDGMRLLRQRCEAGMTARGLDTDSAAMHQLDYELGVIARLHYEAYFLAVAQVVTDTRALGIRVAARGSGAGSMVNHALFVATANPLEHRLLFERFLSERRTSLPDIDLDVEAHRRLEVYDQVFARFGSARVAVTGMPETYRARHALRDTGLALGIRPQTVDRIAKSFPHIRAGDIRSALAELPELRHLAAEADQYGPLWELAEGLDALPRGMAMHPCGVILSDASLLDRLPVQPAPGGSYPTVQADKHDVEDLGLLKLDVLGVRMQSAMAHAVGEIRRTTGRHLDLDSPDHVPLDDPATFELIRSAQVLGCFQLESSGQQDLISRLQPRHMQDVIADISLFRPGPVKGGMPARFIAARHGIEEPRFPHPDLVPIMDDTYGVVIWHEQIMMILSVMTGCDLAAADVARRALADPDRLPRVEAWFRSCAAERGYTPDVTGEVWSTIREFGAYGFCRAHATAFAIPAVQSAWLKAHHPAAFFAGLFEHDPGMWAPRVLVQDAKRHGVAILPVDVNASRRAHTVEPTANGWGVRLALSTVRGITDAESARVEAGQPYTGLQDLWLRARPSLPLAQRLIKIGALGPLQGALTRRDLLLHAAELHRSTCSRATSDGQLPLGDVTDTGEPAGLPEMTSRDVMSAELDVLSIDVTAHLLEHHHRLLAELGATDARHLQALHPGQHVLVAGVRASTQTPPIPSGRRIIFVTLEDGSGMVDLAFFEDSHDACATTIFHSGLLLARGTVEKRGPRRTVVGQMVWDLEEIAAARRDAGPEAALRLLDRTAPAPTPPRTDAPTPAGRTLEDGTAGARLSAWSDLQPAGSRSADLRRLGHRSPGSAG